MGSTDYTIEKWCFVTILLRLLRTMQSILNNLFSERFCFWTHAPYVMHILVIMLTSCHVRWWYVHRFWWWSDSIIIIKDLFVFHLFWLHTKSFPFSHSTLTGKIWAKFQHFRSMHKTIMQSKSPPISWENWRCSDACLIQAIW